MPSPKRLSLVGKTILIRAAFRNGKGRLVRTVQYGGTVLSDGPIVRVRHVHGKLLSLRRDVADFKKAKPGTHRIDPFGDMLTNPDYVVTWTIPADGAGVPNHSTDPTFSSGTPLARPELIHP